VLNHKPGIRGAMAVTSVLEDLLASEVVDTTDVARALGAAPRSVSRWTQAKATPRRDSEERLLELKAVVDLLRTVMRDEPARLWLRSPNPDLGWRKPLDVIAEGDYRSVVGVILAIAEGVTA
jgi:putative toxin-antitoxin system antitoxin component (TIGR02293 family)